MKKEKYDFLFKLTLLGLDNTGKTSLLNRFYDNSFKTRVISTIGLDFRLKTINIEDKVVRLQIWDTAGQECFNAIIKNFLKCIKGLQGFIFVYNITDKHSFQTAINWIKHIETNYSKNINKILVGNKCDLPDRVVTEEEGKKLAEEYNMNFFETSAKNCQNVNEAFNYLIKEIYKSKNIGSDNQINLSSFKILENKYNEEIRKNKKLEEENKNMKEKLKTIINCHLKEINKLNDDLSKANKIISNYQKNEIKNIENNTNNSKNENNKALIDEILNLKNQLDIKQNEIDDLKEKLKNNSITDDKISIDDIIVINFVSADQIIHRGIKCLKTDTFAEVEEKLYKIYDEYRNTNNIGYANAKPILRFKKICENDIKDGDMIQLVKME